MLTKFSAWILFVSSYIPLFIIFAINNLFKYFETKSNSGNIIHPSLNLIIACSFILICIISFILLKVILTLVSSSTESMEVLNITKSNSDIINYLFVYIVPFISIDTSSLKDLIIFFILLIVIGVISVENNLIYINPTLYFMRYNIYKINDKCMLISRKSDVSIKKELGITVSVISKQIYIQK